MVVLIIFHVILQTVINLIMLSIGTQSISPQNYETPFTWDTLQVMQPTLSISNIHRDNTNAVVWINKPGSDEMKSRCSIGWRKALIWSCCWWHICTNIDWTKWTCSDWVQLSNIFPHSSNCSGYCADGALLLCLEIQNPDGNDEPKNCNTQTIEFKLWVKSGLRMCGSANIATSNAVIKL